VSPTDRPVKLNGINIERVRDGKIVEIWHVEDLFGLLQQIGAAPGSGQMVPAPAMMCTTNQRDSGDDLQA
jgi:hypothetical protein